MKEYFWLQYKMANRKLDEAGIHPALAYLSGIALFIAVSEYDFRTIPFAQYAVLLVALSFIIKLSEINKFEFLLAVFGRNKAVKIRIAENLAVAFPFAILLIRHGALCEAALLFAAGLLLAGFSFRTPFNFTVPTPFYKKPFEFAAGFRNTFYIFPIAYFLAYIAGSVENLNLGIAAMLAVFLVCANYYSKPENEYFVWIYAIPPKMFLVEKLKTAVLYSSLLVLPILASLAVFYPQEISAILLFLFLGLLFLVIVILVKYAAYPNKASVPEWIMVSMCINFPPLLLIFLPFLYKKSVKKLNMFLK